MKKFLTLLLAAVMLMTVALPLSSCSEEKRLERMEEPEKAVRLVELAEESLEKAERLHLSSRLFIKNPYYSSSCSVTRTLDLLNGKDEFAYRENVHQVMRLGSEGVIYTAETGYKDGYAFSSHTESVGESYFKAPADGETIRVAEVKSNRGYLAPFRIEDGHCETKTAEKREDGTWVVTFEGFGEDRARSFLSRQHDYALNLTSTHKPMDLRVTLTLAEDYTPTAISAEVTFHKSRENYMARPTVTVQYELDLGEDSVAVTNIRDVNLSGYTELSDMGILNAYFDAVSARERAAQGEFTVETATTVTVGGQTQTGSLTQNVTYANAGGYRFTLKYGVEGGGRYELAYAGTDAFETVYAESGRKLSEQSVKMMDAQARVLVSDIMNTQSLSKGDVETAELISEGSGFYRYTLSEDSARRVASIILSNAFPEGNVKLTAFTCRLDAEIPDGILKSHTLTIHAESTVDGTPLTLDAAVTVTFPD